MENIIVGNNSIKDKMTRIWGNMYESFTGFRETSTLKIRTKLFVWSFQPGKKALKKVPLMTMADFARLPTSALRRSHFGRYWKFVHNFGVYRKNMRRKSWSSLTQIYPRLLYLWFYYMLFWWAEYCGVLPELLSEPDRTLIPELFIRYCVKMDSIVDARGGIEYLLGDSLYIKRNGAEILNELLTHIWGKSRVSLKRENQRLCDTIWKFRQNALTASREAQYLFDLNYPDMLHYKNKTAGDMGRVWTALLCDVYRVGARTNNSIEIIGAVWMAVQVVDDMLDAPTDFRDDVGNIFNQLLKETGELSAAKIYFEKFPYGHMDWAWANKHLPATCKRAAALIDGYTDEISKISEDPILTSELCRILKEWRDISLPAADNPTEE